MHFFKSLTLYLLPLGALGEKKPAADKFQEYSDQAAETYENSREQVSQWLDDVRERATNEPLKTVLMATGVGIVLGVLFG